MKKLLLILLCFPMLGFGQDAGFFNELNRASDYYKKGNDFFIAEKYQSAIDNYTICLNMTEKLGLKESIPFAKTLGITFLARGLAYSNLENYEQAVEDFSKAVKLMPNDSEPYYYLGMTKSLAMKSNTAGCLEFKKGCELGTISSSGREYGLESCKFYSNYCR